MLQQLVYCYIAVYLLSDMTDYELTLTYQCYLILRKLCCRTMKMWSYTVRTKRRCSVATLCSCDTIKMLVTTRKICAEKYHKNTHLKVIPFSGSDVVTAWLMLHRIIFSTVIWLIMYWCTTTMVIFFFGSNVTTACLMIYRIIFAQWHDRLRINSWLWRKLPDIEKGEL